MSILDAFGARRGRRGPLVQPSRSSTDARSSAAAGHPRRPSIARAPGGAPIASLTRAPALRGASRPRHAAGSSGPGVARCASRAPVWAPCSSRRSAVVAAVEDVERIL